MNHRIPRVIPAALALALAPAGLPAQTAAPAPSAPAPEEIIVLEAFNVSDSSRANEWVSTQSLTGARVAENVANLPFQMQIITDDFMKDFNMVSVVDQLSTVSGLTLESDQSDPVSAASRGINGNSDTRLRGFATIPTRDGFKYAQPPTSSNLQQTEVIKGPVSALYGAMQPGGMINYLSKRPSTKRYVEARVSGGSYDYWEVEGCVNTPIIPRKLFFLGSIDRLRRKSDVQWVETTQTTSYASLLYRPFKRTNITVTYEDQLYQGNRNGGTPDWYADSSIRASGDLADPSQVWNWDPNTGVSMGIYWPWVKAGLNMAGPDHYISRRYDRLHVQLEQGFGKNWMLKMGFQWQHKETLINGFNGPNLGRVEDLSDADTPLYLSALVPETSDQDWKYPYAFVGDLLGNIKTGPIKHKLLFTFDASQLKFYSTGRRLSYSSSYRNPGEDHDAFASAAEYYAYRYGNPFDPAFDWHASWWNHDWSALRNRDIANSGDLDSYQRMDLTGGSISERMFLFNDRLILMGCLRFDDTYYVYRRPTATSSSVVEEKSSKDDDDPDDALTWCVGVNGKLFHDDRLILFANYSTSFNTMMQYDAGLNKLMPNETGRGFEGGIKAIHPSGKLALILSVFSITKENVVQDNPQYDGTLGTPQYLGTGTERVSGADLDMNWRPAKSFTLTASGAWMSAKIIETQNEFFKDKRMTRVPEKTFSLAAKYRFDGWLKGVEVNARVRYQSDWIRTNYMPDIYPNAAANIEERIGGVPLWGGSIAYKWSRKKVDHSLLLAASNLFDKINTGVGSSRSMGLQVSLTYRIKYR